MYKMLGPEVRVVVTKAVATRAVVVVMVVVMGRLVVEPMLWIPMSSRVYETCLPQGDQPGSSGHHGHWADEA